MEILSPKKMLFMESYFGPETKIKSFICYDLMPRFHFLKHFCSLTGPMTHLEGKGRVLFTDKIGEEEESEGGEGV